MSRKLILDFDRPVDANELEKRIDFVADIAQVQLMLTTIHKTARGCHAIVLAQAVSMKNREADAIVADMTARGFDVAIETEPVAELSPMEVVALQLLLGSDPNREAFNFQRARVLGNAPAFWQERWNVSYAEKL